MDIRSHLCHFRLCTADRTLFYLSYTLTTSQLLGWPYTWFLPNLIRLLLFLFFRFFPFLFCKHAYFCHFVCLLSDACKICNTVIKMVYFKSRMWFVTWCVPWEISSVAENHMLQVLRFRMWMYRWSTEFIYIIHKNSVPSSQETCFVPITGTSQLTMCRD